VSTTKQHNEAKMITKEHARDLLMPMNLKLVAEASGVGVFTLYRFMAVKNISLDTLEKLDTYFQKRGRL